MCMVQMDMNPLIRTVSSQRTSRLWLKSCAVHSSDDRNRPVAVTPLESEEDSRAARTNEKGSVLWLVQSGNSLARASPSIGSRETGQLHELGPFEAKHDLKPSKAL